MCTLLRRDKPLCQRAVSGHVTVGQGSGFRLSRRRPELSASQTGREKDWLALKEY